VDADELTYNFHIFVRFQIEKDLLEGKMQIRDIPKVWNDLYEETLGLRPPDHKDGCLQDVHWFHGPIGGYFQGYTIGNVLSAQLMEKAVVSHPEIPTQIEKGEFQTLLTWLRKNVHIHGRKYEPHRLIEKACGGPLSTKPYIRYLSNKFLSGDQ
jgi:carboxypeptidase Taq